MFQTQLINQVVDWERRLEIEEEKQKNQRAATYVNYLAPVPPCRKTRKSIFDRVFNTGRDRQPACPCYMQECCPEVQPG